MKTKFTSKFIMLILSVVMIATLFAVISVPAFAVEGDPCTSTDSCTGTYANGFCSVCNGYEPAALNADGYYEIASAGQLFWYANYINTVDRTANAVLTADIDLENRPWTPIGVMGEDSNSFRGVFDGQNYTIKGLNVTAASNGAGFFGEVRTGTVKNFTIYGEVVVNTEVDYIGGVIGSICGLNGETVFGERNGAIIQNITSYVNVTAKAHGVGMIGGFVGYANHESLIENCSWYGTFDAGSYLVDSGAGGFIGKIQGNTSEVTIRNCAAYGTIKTDYAGDISIGGFLGLSDTDAKTTLENCLFAGKFERGENLTDQAFLGAFGTLRSVKEIKNCYYLGDDGLAAVHSESPLGPGSDNVEITSVTGAQLLSGEVAYKLGEHFGQTLEGENRQSYPVLGGTKVKDPQRFEIYGQQLNIGGDLSMKYYVMGYAPEFNSGALYMEFSHNGVKTKVYAGEPNADGFYVFTLEGINPQCMGDSIRAMLYYNETEVTSHGCEDGKEYSVEKNLTNLLEEYKDDAALVALIKDTLAYGEAASAYKDHQTMTGNTYIENSSNREIPVSEADRFEIDPNYPQVEQYTVRFGTTLSIKIKVNYLPAVKVYVNGREYVTTEEDVNRGYIIFESDPISATNFYKDFSVIIQNGEGETYSYIKVSVNDYLYAISQSTDASDEMKALAKALYNYGLSAHVVEGKHEGGTATCVAQAVCTICGNGYGELLKHNYTYTANDETDIITESCDKGCGHNKTITLKAPVNTVYDGSAKEAVVDGSIDADYTVTYDKNEIINVGTYKATLTVGEVSVSLDFEITKATPEVTAPTANTLTYNGEAHELVSAGSTNSGTMVYSLTENGEFTTTIPKGTNAGSYTVYYYVQGNENVSDTAVASVTVTIAKADLSITAAPTPNTLTYTGEAHNLITQGEADIGTMLYSLTENGDYYTTIPKGTNAGDYTVWYYVQGDANHNDSAKDSVSVTIKKATLTVTALDTTITYGEAPTNIGVDIIGFVNGEDVPVLGGVLTYTYTYTQYGDVGEYSITPQGLTADNYEITFVDGTLTVNAKRVSDPTVTLDQISFQYDGSLKEPEVTSVVVDGRTLTEGTDYTVSYENNKYVGEEAAVVINFRGNYDGTFRKLFTITQDPNTTEFDGVWINIPEA